MGKRKKTPQAHGPDAHKVWYVRSMSLDTIARVNKLQYQLKTLHPDQSRTMGELVNLLLVPGLAQYEQYVANAFASIGSPACPPSVQPTPEPVSGTQVPEQDDLPVI